MGGQRQLTWQIVCKWSRLLVRRSKNARLDNEIKVKRLAYQIRNTIPMHTSNIVIAIILI
jgi:hypothetical protein